MAELPPAVINQSRSHNKKEGGRWTQYLVTAEWIELGALLSPEQVVGILDQTVGPSLEMLAQWEEEGKTRGGIFPGERAGAWVFEADSSEELDGMLTTLPF